MLIKSILTALVCVVLSSCSSVDKVSVTEVKTQQHPVWPTPITTYNFDWKVLIEGEKVYVGLEYDQSVEFRVFLEDVKRYMKESNSMICFYREDLKESRCYQQKVVDTSRK